VQLKTVSKIFKWYFFYQWTKPELQSSITYWHYRNAFQ